MSELKTTRKTLDGSTKGALKEKLKTAGKVIASPRSSSWIVLPTSG